MALSSGSQIDLLEAIEASTSSSEAHPVSPSASQGFAVDSLTSAATSHLSLRDWLRRFALGGSSGKTSPEFCPPTKEGLSLPSSGAFQSSGMASHGECWMLNSSDWPSDASVCFLSDILEPLPLPERYFLSPRACAGILRRAKKQDDPLPEMLRLALEHTAMSPDASPQTQTGSTTKRKPSSSKGAEPGDGRR